MEIDYATMVEIDATLQPVVDGAPSSLWRRVDISGSGDAAELADQVAPLLRNSDRPSIEHDIRWLLSEAIGADAEVQPFVAEVGGTIAGYAPFFVHASRIQFWLGEICLFSRPIRRFQLSEGPLLQEADGSLPASKVLGELFIHLRPVLGPGTVIFLRGVRFGTALHEMLTGRNPVSQRFFVFPFGLPYERRLMRFDGSFDDYLQSLGSKTRRDLLRTRRRFAEGVHGNYQIRCFRHPDEVEVFVTDAGAISAKTYQFHLLGLGLRNAETLHKRFEAAARNGWFRSYILYARGKPVAFDVGFQYAGARYSHEAGYDPEWRDLHVGILLDLAIAEELTSNEEKLTVNDLLYGDTVAKRRLSNVSFTERHYYLFPRTLSGASLYYPLRAVNGLSEKTGLLLEKYNLKHRVKRFVRRLG